MCLERTTASAISGTHRRIQGFFLIAACSLVAAGFSAFLRPLSGQSIQFRDVAPAAGIASVPNSPLERRYLLEMMGGGVALFDCDNDGKLDILTVNDSTIGQFLAGGDPMVTLYHQDPARDGKLHFTDTTAQAGLTTLGWGMGIAIGDYDNDGLPDIYVAGYGHNVLYHNLGGCKFEDVTERAGVAGGGFSVGAAWADYNRDGHLDLFVSRYVNTDIQHLPASGSKAFNYQGVEMEIPRASEGQTDFLFRNRGDGTFEDVSEKSGAGNPDRHLGMGIVWADYDNDGWPDLFVTNDVGPNLLLHNQRDGTFEDVALWTGTALGESGENFGNMAADFADVDHDGNLDLFITRSVRQPMNLYLNRKHESFTNVTEQWHLGHAPVSLVRWGSGFADFDNDGWPDILVANGGFTPLLDPVHNEAPFLEPLQLFRHSGKSSYNDVSESSGLNAGAMHSRRGTAFGDVNNDGNIDVVVYNVGGPPSLFLNETRNANHRVLFRLIGTKSNKAAIGARLTLTLAGAKQMDEVRGGGSYLSSNDQRLHFGLGSHGRIALVQIQWPSGLKEELKNIPADAIYTVVEGQGIKETVKLSAPTK